MPQEHQVLQCFSCKTFQVQIVKKARKWECKLCGAKQSFKRHYGKGTGKDCRNHVMKLNELSFTKSYSVDSTDIEIPETSPSKVETVPVEKNLISKWAEFLDEDIEIKQKNRWKVNVGNDKTKNVPEALDTDVDKFIDDQSNIKCTKDVGIEEGITERKKPKSIFDSDLENIDDLLNFI